MKISFNTIEQNLLLSTGYGEAGFNIVTSLQELGYKVPFADPTAPVELWMGWPEFWRWSNPDNYHIGFLPWESTKLQSGWLEKMNQADEVWTPSALVGQWFAEEGVKSLIHIYPHGVKSDTWTPVVRKRGEKVKFLSIGSPAHRKNAQLAFDGFKAAFGSRKDVHLTIKAHGHCDVLSNGRPADTHDNVSVITKQCSVKDMVRLHHEHDFQVYPSMGEGFGMHPLEAAATGMPTICTKAWAPYKDYITLPIESKMVDSPWTDIHPGEMFEPNFDELVESYRFAVIKYDFWQDRAGAKVSSLVEEYDWLKLTRDSFAPLAKCAMIGRNT